MSSASGAKCKAETQNRAAIETTNTLARAESFIVVEVERSEQVKWLVLHCFDCMPFILRGDAEEKKLRPEDPRTCRSNTEDPQSTQNSENGAGAMQCDPRVVCPHKVLQERSMKIEGSENFAFEI